MKILNYHEWPQRTDEAIALQQRLRSQIVTTDQLGTVKTVAGVDVGFEEAGLVTRAAIAVLSFPELQLIEQAIARRPTVFPYIPGLLSFREVPAVLAAMEPLQITPDLLLCDGQGTAHPRHFGIACHLGFLTNLPSIGVAKSWLVGTYTEPAQQRGAWQPLQHQGETIGAVLRTRTGTKPLYISPGHRISLTTAIDYVMQCTPKYRLPETTRMAHKLASGPAPEQISAIDSQPDQQLSLLQGE